MDLGRFRVGPRRARAVADQDRPILDARGAEPVAPPDQRRVERDHVEEGPEAQLLPEQSRRQAELRAARASGRGTARRGRSPASGGCRPSGRSRGPGRRRARTGRRTRRRARTGRRSRPIADGRARPRARASPDRSRATPARRQEVADPGDVGRVPDVDMGDLVVADGERPAGERVEDLAERAGADRRAGRPRAGSGWAGRPGDVAMAVLADDPDPGPDRPGLVEQRGAGVVELAGRAGAGRSRRGRTAGGRSRGGAGRRASGRAARRGATLAAHRAIQAVQASPAAGPQKVWNGNLPSSASSRSVRPSGVPAIPNALLPSAA